jgi:predicted membrane chloride channel (bestrophin family)
MSLTRVLRGLYAEPHWLRYIFSFKHKVISSVCDQEKVVLIQFYEIIIFKILLIAINPSENITCAICTIASAAVSFTGTGNRSFVWTGQKI